MDRVDRHRAASTQRHCGRDGSSWPFLWAALCLALSHDVCASGKPVIHTIVIEGVKFEPGTLTIQRGDVVIWINKDPFPHTVTAAGTFDSHSIAVGHSWKWVARKTGQFAYACTLHPNMKGLLQVH